MEQSALFYQVSSVHGWYPSWNSCFSWCRFLISECCPWIWVSLFPKCSKQGIGCNRVQRLISRCYPVARMFCLKINLTKTSLPCFIGLDPSSKRAWRILPVVHCGCCEKSGSPAHGQNRCRYVLNGGHLHSIFSHTW